MRTHVLGVVSAMVVVLVACSSSTNDAGTSGTSASGGTSGASGSSGTSGGTSGSSGSSGVDAGPTSDAATDAPSDGATGAFTLTSAMLTEGASFMPSNTCTAPVVNTSPPFAWTSAPAGTKSYAMVLTDKSNALVHWVLFDVPASATSLPAAIEKAYQPSNVAGAKQPTSFDNTTRGYLGPCPPAKHTYEFALHALDVTTLPGADMTTTRAQAVTLIAAHELGVAKLTGTYMQ
jgi:Raf kinase inhibitor-like YbhB/YbcL family protein